MNEVKVKALVESPKISSTGRSARARLCGTTPEGKSFFFTALFVGDALVELKKHVESEKPGRLIIEAGAELVNNSFTGNDGQKVYEVLLKVESFETLSSRLKVVKTGNGHKLAKGFVTAVFRGAARRDSRDPHPQFGQRVVVKEVSENGRPATVNLRIPTEIEATFSKGDILDVEGEIVSVYPKGRDGRSEPGIRVGKLTVTAAPEDAAAAPPPTDSIPGSGEDSLPF